MEDDWYKSVAVIEDFVNVTDQSRFVGLPDDWHVGVSDIVNSTEEIAKGRYKAVNLAGAATISAVSNALNGDLRLFIFGGDGARFAVPARHSQKAAEALSRVASWAKQELQLDLRVGMISVEAVRKAGLDVRVAFWKASSNVQYASFMGGGLEWAEEQLKNGSLQIAPTAAEDRPDLTGLSCQWGPVEAQGMILSLIVKPARGVSQARFAEVASRVIDILEGGERLNPVPPDGPRVRWPGNVLDLQSRVAGMGKSRSLWMIRVYLNAAFAWTVFRLGLRVGGFRPARYRREIAENSDYRKFDDSLMMTIDSSAEVIEKARGVLDMEVGKGVVRYGMHTQDEALITCVAPSVHTSNHMHFIDGAKGGYAEAAKQLAQSKTLD
ncbi:DUF3095 domain-containing protein [Hoeflea sp. CAU 1731]